MTGADPSRSAVLHRDLRQQPLLVVEGQGNHLVLSDGRKIFEASGGAAVSCLGYSHQRVRDAIVKQINQVSYAATTFYTTDPCEHLCEFLVQSTGGHMSRAYIVSSGRFAEIPHKSSYLWPAAHPVPGSEAVDAAMKLARQFFLEKDPPEPQRTRFIARSQSYPRNNAGVAIPRRPHVSETKV